MDGLALAGSTTHRLPSAPTHLPKACRRDGATFVVGVPDQLAPGGRPYSVAPAVMQKRFWRFTPALPPV